jgi:hypothetical protein
MNNLPHDVENRFMEKEWENNVKRNFDGSDGPWHVDLPQKPPKAGGSLRGLLSKDKPGTLELQG